MKNNHVSHAPWMMRVSLMLLFMAFSVQWSFAQLDLNVSRTTLGKVIEQIKSQSSYNFFYDDKLASLSVENVKLSNASIEKVLDAVLKGKNIAFKIEGDVIYLSEKSQTPQNGSQQGKERTIIGTVSDDMGPLIVTMLSQSVIFFIFSNASRIFLFATGAQLPFSMKATFLFWKFL